MTNGYLLKLAKECGAVTYTNRNYQDKTAVSFTPSAWEKFCEKSIAAPEQEPADSMGMPLSCGKPLCAPGDHHPLCKLATPPAAQPAPTGQEPVACMVETEQGVMVWPIADYNEACTYCDDGELPVKLGVIRPAAPVQEPSLLAALKAVQGTLIAANEQGMITDTIWFSKYETLFDFIGAEIEKAEKSTPPAAQPAPEPLTDKEITHIIDSMPSGIKGYMKDWDLYVFARAIEAAHEITEKGKS